LKKVGECIRNIKEQREKIAHPLIVGNEQYDENYILGEAGKISPQIQNDVTRLFEMKNKLVGEEADLFDSSTWVAMDKK